MSQFEVVSLRSSAHSRRTLR